MIPTTLGDRIKYVREQNKVPQEVFAVDLRVSRGSLSSYERNESSPKAEFMIDICAQYNVNPQWLLFGKGNPFVTSLPSTLGQNEITNEPIHSGKSVIVELKDLIKILPTKNGKLETFISDFAEFILIPMVGAVLSAGCGSLETEGGSERKYAFRSDFLRRKGNVHEMVVMRVEGDSMCPSIEDGDVVLIDQSQKVLRPDSVYAVGVEDMIYLKRVNAIPGKVILTSDNPDYPSFEVDTNGDLSDLVRIIGRIVWSSREW